MGVFGFVLMLGGTGARGRLRFFFVGSGRGQRDDPGVREGWLI